MHTHDPDPLPPELSAWSDATPERWPADRRFTDITDLTFGGMDYGRFLMVNLTDAPGPCFVRLTGGNDRGMKMLRAGAGTLTFVGTPTGRAGERLGPPVRVEVAGLRVVTTWLPHFGAEVAAAGPYEYAKITSA